MKEAQVSIGEKLKAIKQQQANAEASGEEQHVHDPSKFSFIKTAKLENVHGGAYFYDGNKLKFTKSEDNENQAAGMCIYKTNSAVYQTAEYVDMLCSSLIMFCGYKVVKNSYLMATQTGLMMSYAPFTFTWALIGFIQYHYLAGAYLQQVYLIDQIDLLEDLQRVRIRTVFFNMKKNLFAQARL